MPPQPVSASIQAGQFLSSPYKVDEIIRGLRFTPIVRPRREELGNINREKARLWFKFMNIS